MKNLFSSTLICFILIYLNKINGDDMKLIAGHVLYRHGDRTPVTTFPTDPVKPDDWPNGLGQLTTAGIEQQHRLGGYLRTHYGSILSQIYHPKEIVVRSTDVDRTLMSVQANLIGLYPAINQTNYSVPIQPIPIHTVPISTDFLLGQNKCPRYDEIEDEINRSDEIKQIDEYYDPFFKQLEKWTNLTNITVYNAWDIADTIFVEHIYNKTPEWANEDVRQNLSDINDIAFHYLFASNDSKRIRGGPLIQDMWFNMNNSVNGSNFYKVKMYSAHDTTVSPVLAFLGINYPHQPQYASAVFVDLYKNNTNYFVKVEYLNVTDSNVSYVYQLDGCENSFCSFEKFTEIYQSRFPSTVDVECSKKNPPSPMPDGNNEKMIALIITGIIALVVLIILLFFFIYIRKTRRDPQTFSVVNPIVEQI